MKVIRIAFCIFLISAAGIYGAPDARKPLTIGQSERVYTLAPENKDIRGLAFDDVSPKAPRLFVLDESRRIFAYGFDEKPKAKGGALRLLETIELPPRKDKPLANPRGLAYALVGGKSVFFFLNWDKSAGGVTSELWRCNFDDGVHTRIDLSRHAFRIGQREVLDLTYDAGKMLVCFDATGYLERNLRVRRGIIQLSWNSGDAGALEFVKHLPDSGESPSRGLACMTLEGARYLWATSGEEQLYCADAPTGRGIFYFDRPRSTAENRSSWGLTFGANALWVPERVAGTDRVHRVNVTENLDAFHEGPRILRHLTMTIRSEPEKDSPDPGKVYHYYSRPYAYEQLHNQGVWPETETVADVSKVANAAIKPFTYDPAGDVSSRQFMSLRTPELGRDFGGSAD